MEQRLESVVRTDVLGVPVDVVKPEDLPAVFAQLVEDRQHHQIVFIRLWDLLKARRNRSFRMTLRNASLVIPVTKGIISGARFLQRREPYRYSPFDFVIKLLNAVEQKRASLYLLGLRRNELLRVEQNIRETFPGIRLVGRYAGYYPASVETDIVTAIKKAAPSLLLAGTGVPHGNRWLSGKMAEFHPGIYLWSQEVMDILADRRTRPSRRAVEMGTDYLGEALRRPWRILRFFVYGWYLLLLLVYRLLKK